MRQLKILSIKSLFEEMFWIREEGEEMKILVISPHPDDETLGGGGTIARAKKEGHEVYWLNITAILEHEGWAKEDIAEKECQIENVNQILGFDGRMDLKLPTTKLDLVPCGEGIGYITKYLNQIKPEVIFVADYNDAHSDHRCVFEWLHASTKTFRYPFIKYVLAMEIPSETNFGLPNDPFVPNVYVDISDYMETKIQAMSMYKNEMGEHPFPRSLEAIRALAILRGTESGVKYAEAFRLIKAIV